jgi:aminopeptidase C
MQYKSGIISSSACGTSLNHAVNLVGYGSENGKNFWIVRNSWGTNWGEKGYFRVARSRQDGPGVCGLLKMSSYPIL